MMDASKEELKNKYGIRVLGYTWEWEEKEGDGYGRGASLTPRTPKEIRERMSDDIELTSISPIVALNEVREAFEEGRID